MHRTLPEDLERRGLAQRPGGVFAQARELEALQVVPRRPRQRPDEGLRQLAAHGFLEADGERQVVPCRRLEAHVELRHADDHRHGHGLVAETRDVVLVQPRKGLHAASVEASDNALLQHVHELAARRGLRPADALGPQPQAPGPREASQGRGEAQSDVRAKRLAISVVARQDESHEHVEILLGAHPGIAHGLQDLKQHIERLVLQARRERLDQVVRGSSDLFPRTRL
mmetsp:Transcript_156572/g.502570  ORF Transcript_156572/g.502570 Transcript_156572/m.502570 type:complete len:227 (-) Transcript_156572:1145-1825(-)